MLEFWNHIILMFKVGKIFKLYHKGFNCSYSFSCKH
jgi:hypothetical protein